MHWTAPAEPDLIWYRFRLWREDGTGCVLDKSGYRSDGGLDPWQLTVYRENQTPQWFGENVTYQIFPDRFRRLLIPDPKGLIGRRWVHQDWDDTPEWRPDPDGEIRNRDFFGGSLAGVISRLDYLKDLGVTTLYFCPIFESASNHRYNTAACRLVYARNDLPAARARERRLYLVTVVVGRFHAEDLVHMAERSEQADALDLLVL